MANHSMLDPEERLLLLDALRPPEDYRLSFAIGTTYSLDLLALLTAPLGFTLFELAGPPGNELAPADAVRLLGVLRQYADRMTVFCEAGRIAVPPTHAILFGELEQIVAEVRPPEGRSFHPKVWVLRFEHEDKPVRYRLLCMTRNLTFDRSWDTMLALDGELHDRQLAIAVNHPLADFIQALPGMAKPGSVSDRAHAQVATAADELRRVKFEPPEGFDDFAFHPLGLEPRRHPWPLERADRLLIMSPFLSDGLVDEIAAQAAESILISRPDTLDAISRSVFNNTRTVYSLSPDSTPVEPAGEETAHPDGITASGLHAKLYVAEIGWDARVLTGSANATHAAWYGNIEFLTELIGKRSKCGIDAAARRRGWGIQPPRFSGRVSRRCPRRGGRHGGCALGRHAGRRAAHPGCGIVGGDDIPNGCRDVRHRARVRCGRYPARKTRAGRVPRTPPLVLGADARHGVRAVRRSVRRNHVRGAHLLLRNRGAAYRRPRCRIALLRRERPAHRRAGRPPRAPDPGPPSRPRSRRALPVDASR